MSGKTSFEEMLGLGVAVGVFHTSLLTTGFPSVTVPVLSSTTVFTFLAISRLSASFIRMPLSAPLPMPTIMAVGVASPSAHGQAMMTTVTNANSPWVNPPVPSSNIHTMKASTAMPIMVGTNIPAILSTSCCTGALLPCASCTMCIIFASSVSVPTFSALKRKLPFWLMVPAKTLASFCLDTATGSPLSILSSTYEEPSVTMPSTAIRSPGFTSMMSPGRICSIGTMRSPFPTTVTVLGWSPISFLMAVEVFPFAFSSSRRPSRIKAMMTLAASKYTCGWMPLDSQKSGNSMLNRLNR